MILTGTIEFIVRGLVVKDEEILLCKSLEEGHYFLLTL